MSQEPSVCGLCRTEDGSCQWSLDATAWYRLLPEVLLLINPYMQSFEASALARSPARACSCPGAGNVVAAKHVPGTQCLRLVPD